MEYQRTVESMASKIRFSCVRTFHDMTREDRFKRCLIITSHGKRFPSKGILMLLLGQLNLNSSHAFMCYPDENLSAHTTELLQYV